MKSVVIIGQNGQVSTYLQATLKGDYSVVVLGRDSLDLCELDTIQTTLADLAPSLIINPAAFTAVDLAEQEHEQAYVINRDAVAEIAQYCAKTKTPLIQFSTDYVFDGQADTPYLEDVPAAPTGVYGLSKYEGEQALLATGAPALILRTSWVYSNKGNNFYKTMLKLAQSRDELSVVADQIGSPTYAGSIAVACKALVDIIFNQGGIKPSQAGVYHYSCQGQTSWAEFAKAIFTVNKVENIKVNSISTEQYPTPAKRPAFSVLNNDKLKQEFKVSLPSWQDGLQACADETALQHESQA